MKATWLYIVGVSPRDIPPIPLQLGDSSRKGHPLWRPKVTEREREATPIALCHWLIDLASMCGACQLAA